MNAYNIDIQLLKLNSKYTTKLDLIALDQYYEEKVSDIPKTIGKIIDTIYKVFIDYIEELLKLYRNKKDRKYLDDTLRNLYKAMKSCPELKERRIFIDTGFNIKDENLKLTDKQTEQLSINLANAIRLRDDKRMSDLIEKYYLTRRNSHAKGVYQYDVSIKGAIYEVENGIKLMDRKIEENKLFLNNFRKYFMQVYKEENESVIIKDFTYAVKMIQFHISKSILIFNYNIEDIFRKIHESTLKIVKESGEKYVKAVVPTTDEIMKKSKPIKKIKIGNETFTIYQSEYNNMSAFNIGGHHIFVEKDFFKQPKALQNAILYHEIGHYMKGHFDNSIVFDNRKLEKRFRKEARKFDNLVWNSEWYKTADLNNDNELVYILVELESDRFSSQFVGKRMMKRALDERFSKHIKSLGLEKDVEDYNLFRNKLRLKMI